MASNIQGVSPKNVVCCGLPVLALALFSMFCVYWPEESVAFLAPVWFAIDSVFTAIFLLIGKLFSLIGDSSLWSILMSMYMLISEFIFNAAFALFVPVFCFILISACLLNRTESTDDSYAKLCKAFETSAVVFFGFMVAFMLSMTPHLKDKTITPGVIGVIVISTFIMFVMVYTNEKHNNLFARKEVSNEL